MRSLLISLLAICTVVAVNAGPSSITYHRHPRSTKTKGTPATLPAKLEKDDPKAEVTEKVKEAKEEESVKKDTKPRITYSKEVVAKPKDEVGIFCEVEGVNLATVKDFKITWVKVDEENPTNSLPLTDGQQMIILSHKYTVDYPKDEYKSTLHISDVVEEDTGMYRCLVDFGDNQKVSADIPVVIETPSYFLDNYKKVITVNEFDAISFDCQPGGAPKPDVYWERLNDDLPYYGGQLFKANKLEIPEIKREHKGDYVCHADNGLGTPVMSEVVLQVQYKPDVMVQESEIFVGPIQSVTLTCAARAFPEPDVAWYKDDLIVLSSSNIRVSKDTVQTPPLDPQINVVLTIQEVTAEDYGKYTCKAINIVGESDSSTTLGLKTPPKITKQTKNEVIYEKNVVLARDSLPIVLECEAEGQPFPEYIWSKNGKPLVWQADSRFTLEEGSGNLLMVDVTPADNGYYQCTAYNELGTAVADPIKLVNSEQIEFKDVNQEHYNIEAELGRPFELTCPEVEGYPEPKLTWIKAYERADGKAQLEFIDGERNIAVDGKLFFSHITEDDDSVKNGFKYFCLGSNNLNPNDLNIGSVVNLNVITPEEGPEIHAADIEPVLMYKTENEVTFQAGLDNEIWCVYGGEPNPVVVWEREDGTTIEDDDHFEVKNNGKTLLIKDTSLEDTGVYTCKAFNGIGHQYSQESTTVQVESAPKFEKDMASQTVQEGQSVTFYCDVNSTSELAYNWFFNGRPLVISEGSRRSVDKSELTISKVTAADIGNYACNATNVQGYAYGQAVLNVIGAKTKSASDVDACPSMDGLTSEVSLLRKDLLELRLLIEDYRQNQDHNLVGLMQKIAEYLPKSKPMPQKLSTLFGEVDSQSPAEEAQPNLKNDEDTEEMTTVAPVEEEKE